MKKSREEIKEAILDALKQKPLSIQQISEKAESNWATVNEVLEELKNEKRVKKIISTDKIKFYQKITGDTYYNISISDDQRKEFRHIFSLAIEEFKRIKNRLPNKTELAKVVVDAIIQAKRNLPVVWYIYGQIPLMISDPSRDYSIEAPKNAVDLKKIVIEVIKNQNQKSIRELKQMHYIKYDNSFYKLKEDLLLELSHSKNTEKILDLFNKFYLSCPISERTEIFDFTDRLYSVVSKLDYLNRLENNRYLLIVALESLWKYIAVYMLLDSLTKIGYNKDDLIRFNLGSAIETRKSCAEESISNLESIYLSNLSEKDIKLSKGALKAREIMSDWTGE